MFFKADENFVNKYKEELKNHNGSHLKDIIKYGGKHWAVFTDPDRYLREKAVSIIGEGIVNIPEIKLLSEQESLTIKQLLNLPTDPKYIIKLAQDYQLSELPLKDLDSAVAGELIFCTLIRKRDAHEYNRSYINEEIPVFYDSHVSFGWDPDRKEIDKFFSYTGLGEAGAWKLVEINSKEEIKKYWRVAGPNSIHCIYDSENFKSKLTTIGKQIIQRISEKNEELASINMPISSGDALVNFLSYTTRDLNATIDYLLEKIK